MGLFNREEIKTVQLLDTEKLDLKTENNELKKYSKEMEEKYFAEYKKNLELIAEKSKLDFLNQILLMAIESQEDTKIIKLNNKLYKVIDKIICDKQGCIESVTLNASLVREVNNGTMDKEPK